MVHLAPSFLALAILGLVATVRADTGDYDIHHLPHQTDVAHGQSGVNDCIKTYGDSAPDAKCQTAVINSVTEFCLWAPQYSATIGDRERDVVAYCTKSGFGTRLIPDGTIKGAQFRITPSYVQVTGLCDCTKINVAPGDDGGELDPHGADGSGNPVGGLVFTNAWSSDPQQYTQVSSQSTHTASRLEGDGLADFSFLGHPPVLDSLQIKEWSSFIGHDEFSFRACRGPNAADYCPHIYDGKIALPQEAGAGEPYEAGVFEECDATEGHFPGVYKGVRWWQSNPGPVPPAHKAGVTSNCREFKGIRQRRSKNPPTQSRRRSILWGRGAVAEEEDGEAEVLH
ncbi:hypothetical protein OC834_006455 [Tilletia horrida]|nr:hypothetical protein OC834_006455 [Tilletia horrida]